MFKEHTWYQRALMILGIVLMIAVTVYTAAMYGSIAGQIPTHFNWTGEADAFGPKASLIVPLVIGWIIVISLTITGLFPAVWNTGTAVTSKSKKKIFSVIRTMLSVFIFVIAAFYSYTIFCQIRGTDMHPAAVPLFVILIFAPLILCIIRIVRNR